MKKVIIALIAIVAMASCKKENVTTVETPTPVPTVTKNLLKNVWVINNGTPETSIYTYNAQGKITELKEDTRTTTFNFVSATSLLTTELKNADNSVANTKECTLNDKGYLTKMVIKNPAGAVTLTYEYTYNTDGYMTNQKGTYANGSTLEFVYLITNGNMVSSKLYYDNILSNNTEYIYDNTKINKTQFGIGGYWNVPNLFGKSEKNIITESKTFNSSGTLTWHTQSTYEFDVDGYPTKQTVNYLLTGKQGVNTFTYQ
jgi:hypothetical protein